MAKKIRNFAAILAVSAVVGTILLVLVFLLPVGPMRKNVEKSVGDMLKTGDEIPEDAFSQYLWKNRETYTDAIMVQNAIERLSDKNAYEHAMWMYHYDLEEDVWTPEDSLKSFCESHENVNNMYLHIYARYWHGYLLYLKPLLLLFSWQHVVWLELAVQMAEGKKKHLLNGKPKRTADLKGLVPSVTFTPDDLELAKGAMSVRRT